VANEQRDTQMLLNLLNLAPDRTLRDEQFGGRQPDY